MTQTELYQALRGALDTARRRPRELVGTLRPEQRAWHPPEGGWSVDEVLEHICAIDEPYMARLRARDDAEPRATAAEPWSGRWGGRFLVWGLRLKRARLPTLKAYRHPVPRAQVLEAVESHIAEVQHVMERSRPLAWRRIRFRSPVSALLPLNLGDAFRILTYHALRHYGQIERLCAHPGFPR